MKTIHICAASVAVIAVPAAAQEASDTSADNDIVVLASGFEEPREDTGASITVVERDRIEQLQALTVEDVLRTLPGLAVTPRGSTGGLTSVFVRGGNSGQTLVLIDGVRANDISTPNGLFDFGPILAGNVGRIEVLRGPNSIVWGSQAIGGVVNIETIRPDGPVGVDAGLEYGADDTVSGHANISGRSGMLEASFGGAVTRTDGISAIRGGAELDGSRIYSLDGRLKANLTSSFNFDLRGWFNDARVEYDNPFAFSTTPAEARPVAFNKQLVLYAGVNLDLADGRLRNRVAYTRTDIDRRGEDPEAFSYNTYQATAKIDRVEYRGAFDVAAFATITAGVEYEETSSATRFEADPVTAARSDTTSGYAQLSLRPVTGLTMTGGVRHDSFSLYGDHTTLGGNIAYTPNDGATVVRATYGEGFRAPSFTDALPPFGNPDLKPETSRNFDIGVEQALLDERVRLAATYFGRRTKDQIGYDAFFVPRNIERVDTDGVELTLIAEPVPALRIEGHYTLTDSFNRSGIYDGKRLELRPRHMGSTSIDWTSPIGLAVGSTLTVAGDSFSDRANTVRNKGYTLFDLRASFPITQGIEIYGRIENLFDEDYTIVTDASSGLSYNTYGRSAFGGVRVRL